MGEASAPLAQGTFERTIEVGEPADLLVKTTAGSIVVRSGDDAVIRVVV